MCQHHDEGRPIRKNPCVRLTETQSASDPDIWLWVDEVLLDSRNEALVPDYCVVPVDQMSDEAGVELGSAIQSSRGFITSFYHTREGRQSSTQSQTNHGFEIHFGALQYNHHGRISRSTRVAIK